MNQNMIDPATKIVDKYFYNLNEKLGQGSFGTVYLGHSIENPSQVYAIKVIPISILQTDPTLRESLLNEMKVMGLLNHENIVRCYDVLSSINNHYFIMEYCPHGTLSEYLRKKKKLPEKEALNIFIQLLKGYYEMLKLGIIHRDLKPANILLKNDVFKLADFGFSKCVENFTKDVLKSLVGTPLYMSPQILQAKEYSTKADLWSLALIYYEMIYGRTPWHAQSNYELISKILTQPLSFPNDVKVSSETKEFLTGALQIEEFRRFSWEDVFCHKLFGDCFEYRKRKKEMMKHAQNIQVILREKIIENNFDLFKLFLEIDKNGNNQLEIQEFAILLKKIDAKISREEIEFVFNSIDEDGNNVISLYEFRKWLSNTQQVPAQPPQILQKKKSLNIEHNQNYKNNYYNNNNNGLNNYVTSNRAPVYIPQVIDGKNRSFSAFSPPPLIPPKPFHHFPPPIMPLNSSGTLPGRPPLMHPPPFIHGQGFGTPLNQPGQHFAPPGQFPNFKYY